MKFSRIALMALVAGVFLVSCNEKKTTELNTENNAVEATSDTLNTTSEGVTGTIEKATFQIEGMTCAIGCAKLIEGKLAGLEGVKTATVDFETKTANVEFDDTKQDVAALINTVEKIANGIYTVDKASIASVK